MDKVPDISLTAAGRPMRSHWPTSMQRKFQKEVRCLAELNGDSRWISLALIVECRILLARRQFQPALSVARDAKRRAANAGQAMCRAEALIAESEALAALGEREDAAKRLEEALSTAGDNQQTQAVCHLRLAKLALSGDKLQAAKGRFEFWLNIEKGMQNQLVRDLAEEVRQGIEERRKDFLISWSTMDLDSKAHTGRLWDFLHGRACELYPLKKERAKALGVSRTTLDKRER